MQCFVSSHQVQFPKIIKESESSLRIHIGPGHSPWHTLLGLPVIHMHAPFCLRPFGQITGHTPLTVCCFLWLPSCLLIILTRLKMLKNLKINMSIHKLIWFGWNGFGSYTSPFLPVYIWKMDTWNKVHNLGTKKGKFWKNNESHVHYFVRRYKLLYPL